MCSDRNSFPYMANKVVYEHILEAKKYTKDKHWIDLLDTCARNKFPKGIKYNQNKGVLYVRTDMTGKSKTETVALPTDAKGCYNTLMHVFREMLRLKSDEDVIFSKQQLEMARKQNNIDLECDWKQLKPRTVKNHILMNYAITQVELYELPSKTVGRLYRLIQLGIQFKNLSSDDFEYENGVILSVGGLEFDEDTQFFVLSNKQGTLSHVSNSKNSYNHLEKSVEKWAKDCVAHNIRV